MIVTRFAPSPTGCLHLGHALAAITACEMAKRNGGRFLLRIEDIDTSRCRPEFEQAIFEDLQWLGLDWERPVLRQSDRFDAYRSALGKLDCLNLLYPCFCTRAEIAAEIARSAEAPHRLESPIYPGTCRTMDAPERLRRIDAGMPYCLRLDAGKASERAGPLHFQEDGSGPNGEKGPIRVDPWLFGDIVLARKDTPASYHLAAVVDDAFQGVTLVTRGNDLFAATSIQRLLQALLNLPQPTYAHHRLVVDQNGKKFSKRDHAVTLRSLRDGGATPKEIRERIGC